MSLLITFLVARQKKMRDVKTQIKSTVNGWVVEYHIKTGKKDETMIRQRKYVMTKEEAEAVKEKWDNPTTTIYICVLCRARFNRKRGLSRHLKKMHNESNKKCLMEKKNLYKWEV